MVAEMPPPSKVALLPLTVELVRLAVTASMPPPTRLEVLPLTVELMSVAVPALMPPPNVPALLPLTVELVSVTAWAEMPPPPSPLPAVLPLTVELVIESVEPFCACEVDPAPFVGGVAADDDAVEREGLAGASDRAAVAPWPPVSVTSLMVTLIGVSATNFSRSKMRKSPAPRPGSRWIVRFVAPVPVMVTLSVMVGSAVSSDIVCGEAKTPAVSKAIS